MDIKEEQEGRWGLPDIGIPSEILFHPELTNTEMILFGILRNLSQSPRGCWATNRFLGKLLRVGPQTISNGVQNLKKWKFILVRFVPDRMTGENERRIYINPEYSRIYRKLSEAGNELQTGNTDLLEEQYRDIKNLIRPPKETYNNEVEREKDSKYNNFMDENLSSKPKRTTNLSPSNKSAERSAAFIPIAEMLVDIVRQKKNIQCPPSKLKQWADEIRKLSEQEKINPAKIERNLKIYSSHYLEEYWPVIESGSSLREKWSKLENAITRNTKQPSSIPTGAPDKRRPGFFGKLDNVDMDDDVCDGIVTLTKREWLREFERDGIDYWKGAPRR